MNDYEFIKLGSLLGAFGTLLSMTRIILTQGTTWHVFVLGGLASVCLSIFTLTKKNKGEKNARHRSIKNHKDY